MENFIFIHEDTHNENDVENIVKNCKFDAMFYHYHLTVLQNGDKVCGNAYNIGGTMAQSLSLLELFDMLNGMLGIKMRYTQLPVRCSDQKVFVADTTKI